MTLLVIFLFADFLLHMDGNALYERLVHYFNSTYWTSFYTKSKRPNYWNILAKLCAVAQHWEFVKYICCKVSECTHAGVFCNRKSLFLQYLENKDELLKPGENDEWDSQSLFEIFVKFLKVILLRNTSRADQLLIQPGSDMNTTVGWTHSLICMLFVMSIGIICVPFILKKKKTSSKKLFSLLNWL